MAKIKFRNGTILTVKKDSGFLVDFTITDKYGEEISSGFITEWGTVSLYDPNHEYSFNGDKTHATLRKGEVIEATL